jgi:hypothetical protein
MVEGEETGRRWPLSERGLTIGRAADNDVVLAGKQVSRHHAWIRWIGDHFQVEDLGSKNGTYVNGEPVSRPLKLRAGDLLQLAIGYTFSLVETTPIPEVLAGVSAPPPAPRLVLDTASKRVWVRGQEVMPPLSPAQFAFLALLSSKRNQVVSRDEIVQAVWGIDAQEGVTEEAIDALVRRLRRRIAKLDPSHAYIVTVRGHGFRLQEETTDD